MEAEKNVVICILSPRNNILKQRKHHNYGPDQTTLEIYQDLQVKFGTIFYFPDPEEARFRNVSTRVFYPVDNTTRLTNCQLYSLNLGFMYIVYFVIIIFLMPKGRCRGIKRRGCQGYTGGGRIFSGMLQTVDEEGGASESINEEWEEKGRE